MSPIRINPDNSILLICDLQERFRSLIYNMNTCINTAEYLIKICQILNINILISEQYPKAFGHTVNELLGVITSESEDICNEYYIYDKKLFSMINENALNFLNRQFIDENNNENNEKNDENNEILNNNLKKNIILIGIESHVCLLQTCLDLIERNYNVFIVIDGISSQRLYDRQIALDRMKNEGAILITAESLVFELMRTANHEKFKMISNLTKEHALKPNEWNISANL